MSLSMQGRRALAYSLIVLFGLATALVLGKDLNWDQLNYHFYAGFNALENRLAVDYFPASVQGYLNPYSHVPLYLMIRHDLAPQLIVCALALFQLLNLCIVYEIAVLLNVRSDGAIAWPAVGLAVVLAFVNPIFIFELGNSFNEITTSVLVLAGWYLLIRGFGAPRRRHLVCAGLLIGAAVSLKMSNLFFTVSALPLLLCAPTSWKARAQAVLVFGLAGVAGTVLAGGWWAWQLWEQMGNPFFPQLNQYFHSPHLTDEPLKHYRFLPTSLLDILGKPFMMAVPLRGVHFEIAAPDIRYGALLLLLALFGAKHALVKRPAGTWFRNDPFPAFEGQRLLAALGLSLLCAWAMWMASSGNSRYFLPMSCLVAVLLASLLVRLTGKLRFVVYAGIALMLVQAALTGFMKDHRWAASGYGSSWYELEIPAPLQKEPALYLHLDAMSASFLLPYLPPGSSMINISGQIVVEENARTRALMDKYRGHVRVMRRFDTLPDDLTLDETKFRFGLVRYGLEVDADTCLTIRLLQRDATPAGDAWRDYVSCATRPLQWSIARRQAFLESKRRADALFARLETMCPLLFQPRGLASETNGVEYWRNYGNTDLLLQQNEKGVLSYKNLFTGSPPVRIGTIDEMEKNMLPKSQVCP